MNRKKTKRRRLSRIAAAAALIIILSAVFPVTNVLADYSIDDSEFQDISKNLEQTTVYVWHKGKPPVTVNQTGYPVIMAWDGKYYFDLLWSAGATVINKDATDFTARVFYLLLEEQNAYKTDGSRYYDGDWCVLRYRCWQSYVGRNVSTLPLNFATLSKYGTALSYTLPDVPVFYAASGSVATDKESYYGISTKGKTADNRYQWICSMMSLYAKVDTSILGYDDMERFSVDFLLEVPIAGLGDFLANKNLKLTYRDREGIWNKTVETSFAQRAWDVRLESNGLYSFQQTAKSIDRKRRHSTSWACSCHAYWDDIKTLTGKMELYHSDSNWGNHGYSYGGTTSDAKKMKFDQEYITTSAPNSDWTFDLYYATTMPMSFLKGDFTVRNGQTVNLDGPLSINKNVTVTVEDGGVLCVSGWVVNNGKINVKPGGTLMIMKTDDSNGLLATYNSTPDESAGAIYCDGTIIVMPNCKLHTGGNVGLRLGSTAQVVNYGAVIASNLKVSNNYTIENRGDNSCVLVGYDVTDGGFTLTASSITARHVTWYDDGTGNKYSIYRPGEDADGVTYAGEGSIQRMYSASMPADAVYGKSKDMVFFSIDNTGGVPNVYKTNETPSTNTFYTN